MTRNDLAHPPSEAAPNAIDPEILDRLDRLTLALEGLAAQMGVDPELQLFTPAEAGALLGKTENWVIEAIHANRIPRTYLGKSPRLSAAHIREIAASGEVRPHKYARKPHAA